MFANILGIPVSSMNMQQTLAYIKERITANQQTFVVTANAEIIMLTCENNKFFDIVANRANLVIPDGDGVVIGARFLGYDLPEKVAGCDLVEKLLPLAEEHGWGIFLLGAHEETLKTTAENILLKHPQINLVGIRDGFFNSSQVDEIITDINSSKADILLVALGFPKQEFFISENINRLSPALLIGVGGTFDVIAGSVQRAPVIMQKYRLEWLYRLIKQPSRFMRMLALPKFAWKIFAKRLLDK